ncbi:DUF3597 domain-containing protein [Aurantiacibacter gilvus]|uniref:DUF3597 domain-containing protein n=1 Tax=Aurantiacibacter gilvus TaxID=3139141 RepID=A0ABU9IDB5_9SPHN
MGIFSSIKDAIFGSDEAEATPATKGASKAPSASTSSGFGRADTKGEAIDEVDLEAVLDAKDGSDKFNWRTSIVDLMKLVGLEPSYENRKELAHELGDTDYSGKAEENIALHAHVMEKLAENGAKVPQSLRG